LLSERVAVERKTTNDFISSIIDHRLFKQIGELKDNFEAPVIMIEGDDLFHKDRKMNPNAIRGALASVAIEYSLPLIWTRTPLESAEMLFSIAKREQFHMKRCVGVRGKKRRRSENQEQEFLIAGLPHINSTIAKRLLKHFGSPSKIFSADETELKRIEGIGTKKAKDIKKILDKIYEKSILE
jgi:Fanconi anemia group M protein